MTSQNLAKLFMKPEALKTTDLNAAKIKWATYCLDNFGGKLLEAGLEISKAMAGFEQAVKRIGKETI